MSTLSSDNNPVQAQGWCEVLTLSLAKIMCGGSNLFPKEPCRWVKLARNIHLLERGLALMSMHEQPEFEQGVPWCLFSKWETLRHGRHMTSYGQGRG